MFIRVVPVFMMRKGDLIYIGSLMYVVTRNPVKDFMGDFALHLQSTSTLDNIDMRTKHNHLMEVYIPLM